MTYIAVTVFDHPDEASEGMHALRENGFDVSNIEYIESDPDNQNFFKRAFTREGGEEFEAQRARDVLMDMGLAEADSKRYAKKVKKGHSLVITRCDRREEADRVRKTLDELPLGHSEEEPATAPQHLGTERTGGPKQPGFGSAAGAAHVDEEALEGTETAEVREATASQPTSAAAGDEMQPPMGATQAEEREPQEEYIEPAGFADISDEDEDEQEHDEDENIYRPRPGREGM